MEFNQWIRHHPFTPSELEAYAACPFSFYAKSYLGVKPIPEHQPELTPAEIGTLTHRTLEKFFRQSPKNLDRLLAIADQELSLLQKTRQNLVPILVEIQQQKMHQTLKAFHEKESLKTLCPTYFEWSFGAQGHGSTVTSPEGALRGRLHPRRSQGGVEGATRAPLELPDGQGGKLKIQGRIDRIDVDQKNKKFLVIDYKTGSQKMTGNRILKGEALQLPLYILAVQELLLPDFEPIGGLYYHLSDLTLDTGIVHADRIPERLEISPRSSSIIPASRWNQLFATAKTKVQALVTRMRRQDFFSSPETCTPWCPYQDICKIRAAYGLRLVEGIFE